MASANVRDFRKRRREAGFRRIEVEALAQDIPLIRRVAASLADPARRAFALKTLEQNLHPPPRRSLKDLLAAAPLEGFDLERPRDVGREVDL
jgi:hypothetical protein